MIRKSVSDLIRAGDDERLEALFVEVMESHDIRRMVALAQEYIEAYIEFNAEDSSYLDNAMELLKVIRVITTSQSKR